MASVRLSLLLGPGAFEDYKWLFRCIRCFPVIGFRLCVNIPKVMLCPSHPIQSGDTSISDVNLDSWSGGVGQASPQSYFPLGNY